MLGFLTLKASAMSCPPDASAEEIGTAILDALAHSRFIPPSHPDFDALFKERKAAELVDAYDAELMRLARVKTKASLYRGAKGVNVTHHADWGEIKIHAFARRKGRYFWSKKTDPTGNETVSYGASARELGETYLRALEQGGAVS
ncbi:MAG: contact-dependent growth inhibition system immunity protein [Paracoccaceae bacterium]